MLIDTFLPEYDFTEVHQSRIRATPARVYQSIREVTTAELPLFHVLMTIRMLPAILSQRLDKPLVPSGSLIDWTDELGVLMVAEPDQELVFGIAGQFWKLHGSALARITDAHDFQSFAEPGSARVATNFFLQPDNGATHLRTETRIQAIDAEARRKFGFYWRIIYPGSSLIRVEWLRAIRTRAERSDLFPSQTPVNGA